MVANALLAPSLQRLLVEIKPGCCDLSQILFDDILILRGRWNEGGIEDRPVGIETIAVIKNSARRLGAGVANASTRLGWDERSRRRLVAGDQTQCLITGIDDFDPANEDAAEWIAAYRLRARLRRQARGYRPASGPG